MQINPQIPAVLTRGVAQVLPSVETLAARMAAGPIKLYLGIDPTGSLLTLGHSISLRKLQQFADLGHDVTLLIGNGTVKIGDPTGKDAARPTLTDAEIEANFKTWQEQANKILNFDQIKIAHNGDWLDAMTMPEIIRLMAKVTVSQLIERDMFQERIAQNKPIFGHEIMYPMLQGYDSVAMDVDLEIGGTDQTFNMMMGRQLQRIYHDKEKWVLSVPIINGLDGRKMSKSFNNFVALTDQPQDMYGKLMSIADDQIIEYFTLLTDVSLSDIDQMAAAMRAGDNPMEFKKSLALTITEQYHTPELARQAQAHFEQTVQAKQLPDQIPIVQVPHQQLPLLDLLQLCLPAYSKSQLRRLVDQSAVEILPTGQRPTDPALQVGTAEVEVIRIGKRQFFRINHD